MGGFYKATVVSQGYSKITNTANTANHKNMLYTFYFCRKVRLVQYLILFYLQFHWTRIFKKYST